MGFQQPRSRDAKSLAIVKCQIAPRQLTSHFIFYTFPRSFVLECNNPSACFVFFASNFLLVRCCVEGFLVSSGRSRVSSSTNHTRRLSLPSPLLSICIVQCSSAVHPRLFCLPTVARDACSILSPRLIFENPWLQYDLCGMSLLPCKEMGLFSPPMRDYICIVIAVSFVS